MGILLSQVDNLGVINITNTEFIDALSCNGQEFSPGRYYKVKFRTTYYLRKGINPNDFIERGVDLDAPPIYYTFCTDVNTSYGQNFIDNNPMAQLGAMEELTFLAIGAHEVNPNPTSAQFPQDNITQEQTNDSRYYMGKITYRKDNELNIETHYDQRSVRFRRQNRTIDTITVQPVDGLITQIDLPIEIGSSNISEELNKFTSQFETDPLMLIGRDQNNTIAPIGLNYDDYFTFGGGVVISGGSNINVNIDEASNQPVTNSTIFYQNVPKNNINDLRFRNISIGKVKEQVLCGMGQGYLPSSITTTPCSNTPTYGQETGAGPGTGPCSTSSGSGSGDIESTNYNYDIELNNIVILSPTTVYVDGVPTIKPCQNIKIGTSLRGTIDGQGFYNVSIDNNFENNIIISNQPCNDATYGSGYEDLDGDFNIDSFISTDFNNCIITGDFKNNLIQMPFNNNIIYGDFVGNYLNSDAKYYRYDSSKAHNFSNNYITSNFSDNEITQSVNDCKFEAGFTNNYIKALNPIAGDNYNRNIESVMIGSKFYKFISYINFTLMEQTQMSTSFVGMLKSLSYKQFGANASFQETSTFETGLLFPQIPLSTELDFNDPSFKVIGTCYLTPSSDLAEGEIQQLDLITGDYIPDGNFTLIPVSYRIQNMLFLSDNVGNTEFIKTYNILTTDNSIDLTSEVDYYNPLTPNIISNDITTKFVDSQKRIQLGHTNGITLYDNTTFYTLNSISDLGGSFSINLFYEDSLNRIQIGHSNGVTVYDSGTQYYINNSSKINFNNLDVIAIYEDSQNRIQLGTNGGGVSVYMNNYTLSAIISAAPADTTKKLSIADTPVTIGLNTFVYFNSLGNVLNIVNGIYENKEGKIFLSTIGNGVSMIDQSIVLSGNDIAINFVRFTQTAANGTRQFSHLSASNIDVIQMLEDFEGNMQFATPFGVSKRTSSNIQTVYDNLKQNGIAFISETHFSDINITKMYLDTFGNIWFLNSLGLDMYDGQFNQYNFIGTHYITSSDFKIVYQDRIGNMWFATDEPTSTPSVLKYKDGEFTLYSTIGEHFISNAGAVKSIYESTNGDIQFGMANGSVSQYNGSTQDYYTIMGTEISMILEDLSSVNYTDQVLGLNSINTTNLTNPLSTQVLAGNNISLATDVLDLWSKTNDQVQLGEKYFLNDTLDYKLSYSIKQYLENPLDPDLSNFSIYEYNGLIDSNNIESVMEDLYINKVEDSKIYVNSNTMSIYKIKNYDLISALTDYIADPEDDALANYSFIKYIQSGNLTSPIQSINMVNNGSGYTTASVTTTGNALTSYIQTINVTSGGSGYTTASVGFTGGDGTGVVATANLTNVIDSLTIINGGTGYGLNTSINVIGGGGSGAQITPIISGGVITSYVIVNAGSGYTSIPTITVTGSGSGANISATITGIVQSINITNMGSGYTIAPTVNITGDGIGATATAQLSTAYSVEIINVVDTINVITGGLGYDINTTIEFVGGGSGAIGVPVLGVGGVITAITVIAGGEYTSAPTIVINGVGTGAVATAVLTGVVNGISVINGGSGYSIEPIITISGDGIGATATSKLNTAITVDNVVSVINSAYVQLSNVLVNSSLSIIGVSQNTYDKYFNVTGLTTYNGLNLVVDSLNDNEIVIVSINDLDVIEKFSYSFDIYKNIEILINDDLLDTQAIITSIVNPNLIKNNKIYYQVTGQNNQSK